MKFAKGDRVKLSAAAHANTVYRDRADRVGVVIGFGSGVERWLVTRVLWDGAKCPVGLSNDYLELEFAPARPSS